MTDEPKTRTEPDRSGARPSRSIALVGLMGAGKTTIGRKLAQMLALPFRDTDQEIEKAARMTVAEIFEAYGEEEFRALEARVVARLACERVQVVATGGGAYMNPETRVILKENAVTVWLRADLDLLMERVSRRSNRPLLKAPDPRRVMSDLMAERYPVYAEADIVVNSRGVKTETIAAEVADAVAAHLGRLEQTCP